MWEELKGPTVPIVPSRIFDDCQLYVKDNSCIVPYAYSVQKVGGNPPFQKSGGGGDWYMRWIFTLELWVRMFAFVNPIRLS